MQIFIENIYGYECYISIIWDINFIEICRYQNLINGNLDKGKLFASYSLNLIGTN